jgi:hypothetical protein
MYVGVRDLADEGGSKKLSSRSRSFFLQREVNKTRHQPGIIQGDSALVLAALQM